MPSRPHSPAPLGALQPPKPATHAAASASDHHRHVATTSITLFSRSITVLHIGHSREAAMISEVSLSTHRQVVVQHVQAAAVVVHAHLAEVAIKIFSHYRFTHRSRLFRHLLTIFARGFYLRPLPRGAGFTACSMPSCRGKFTGLPRRAACSSYMRAASFSSW